MQPGYQTIFASISPMAVLGSLLTMTLELANSSTGDKGAYSGKGDKLLNTK